MILLYSYMPYSHTNLFNSLTLVNQLLKQKKDLYKVLNATHKIIVVANDKQVESNEKLIEWARYSLADRVSD